MTLVAKQVLYLILGSALLFATPALLTRTSSLPNVSWTNAAAASMESSSVTSSWMAERVPLIEENSRRLVTAA